MKKGIGLVITKFLTAEDQYWPFYPSVVIEFQPLTVTSLFQGGVD